jgi:hypothetical protein
MGRILAVEASHGRISNAFATAWLIIAVTLGIVVGNAAFGSGRVTYHRIVGAILLYLLIAMLFTTLYAFVGLS